MRHNGAPKPPVLLGAGNSEIWNERQGNGETRFVVRGAGSPTSDEGRSTRRPRSKRL